MDIVTQKQQTVQCKVLTESGQAVNLAVDIVTQKKQTIDCEVLTDSEHNIEDSIGHSDTESSDGLVWRICRL